MAKVYINPGHDRDYDSGAVHPVTKLREADVVKKVGDLVADYLTMVGYDVLVRQSDNLYYDTVHEDRNVAVIDEANAWGADVFVSVHCNAFNCQAHGTETLSYTNSGNGYKLAGHIQTQIIDSLGTLDRGVKSRPGLLVLKHTNMPAALVELAFIDNDADMELLANRQDDFARAVARGITDYFADPNR